MTKLKYLHMQKREQKENSWQEPKKKKTIANHQPNCWPADRLRQAGSVIQDDNDGVGVADSSAGWGCAAAAAPAATAAGARHVGQDEWRPPASQRSMQRAWKPWRQAGMTRTASPSANSTRQMAHSAAAPASLVPAAEYTRAGGGGGGASSSTGGFSGSSTDTPLPLLRLLLP